MVRYRDMKHHDISISSLGYNMNPSFHLTSYLLAISDYMSSVTHDSLCYINILTNLLTYMGPVHGLY